MLSTGIGSLLTNAAILNNGGIAIKPAGITQVRLPMQAKASAIYRERLSRVSCVKR